MTASPDIDFDHVMEIACIQTITILYKYFYIWELNLRFHNINLHQFISIIIFSLLLSSLLNFWITSKSLRVHLRFISRSLMVDFILFYFLSYFIFLFLFLSFIFYFYFLFLEQLRLEFISHTVTSVTNWWHSHKTNHRTQENRVEGSGIKWRHTAWTTHVGLMSYTWSLE